MSGTLPLTQPLTCSPNVLETTQGQLNRDACGSNVQRLPPRTTVTINQRETHNSHALCELRGFLFCSKCGYYATVVAGKKSAAKKLMEPCQPKDTGAGANCLRRFRQELPPKEELGWPDDQQVSSSSSSPNTKKKYSPSASSHNLRHAQI